MTIVPLIKNYIKFSKKRGIFNDGKILRTINKGLDYISNLNIKRQYAIDLYRLNELIMDTLKEEKNFPNLNCYLYNLRINSLKRLLKETEYETAWKQWIDFNQIKTKTLLKNLKRLPKLIYYTSNVIDHIYQKTKPKIKINIELKFKTFYAQILGKTMPEIYTYKNEMKFAKFRYEILMEIAEMEKDKLINLTLDHLWFQKFTGPVGNK